MELELLKKFIAICEEQNLKYYLVGGSVLGAVRHKGFIPWDDDIDVGMPREDFNRLIHLAPQINGNECHIALEERHLHGIPKMYDMHTALTSSDSLVIHPWIDIFPIDALPSGIVSRKIFYWQFAFKRKLHQISQPERLINHQRKRPYYQKIFIELCRIFRAKDWFNTAKRFDSIEKKLQKYSFDGSIYCANLWGTYKQKEICRTEWFGGGVKRPFEAVEVIIPQNYHAYLTHLYGDYMTPKVWSHDAVLIEE